MNLVDMDARIVGNANMDHLKMVAALVTTKLAEVRFYKV